MAYYHVPEEVPGERQVPWLRAGNGKPAEVILQDPCSSGWILSSKNAP
jgi:hypothetical protein